MIIIHHNRHLESHLDEPQFALTTSLSMSLRGWIIYRTVVGIITRAEQLWHPN